MQTRYASFTRPDRISTWGIESGGRLFDLGLSGTNIAPTLSTAIADGLIEAQPPVPNGAESFAVTDIEFLPCIPTPGKILCIGVNFRTHQAETGRTDTTAPVVFTRFADTQIGHLQPANYPATSEKFDYEGELALVIGRGGYRIPESVAMEYVAGYAPFNDFSVRDWQLAASQWTPGKNFAGTGAFGPYLVPAREITDVSALTLQTRVNGEVRQEASLASLIFSIPEIIAHVSGFTRLSPGDIIVTGTPGGVGLFTPSGLLDDGDVVEVEISGMEVLRNTVRRESPVT